MQPPTGKRFPSIFDADYAPVYSLDYHGYHGAKGHLKPTAGILSRAIDVVKRDSQASDVYIVAHSMGGLMARAVMEGLAVDPANYDSHDNERRRNDIYGLMTIDTPHRGCIPAAGLIGFADHAWGDMVPDSDFMKDLNRVPTHTDPTFCSVVVGNAQTSAWREAGDGVLTVTEQTPIGGTVPSSTEIRPFMVVHGNGNTEGGKYTTALASAAVKAWAVERYRQALNKYQEPNQSPGGPCTSLVLDVSGTMGDSFQGTTKIDKAKAAAKGLVSSIQQTSQLTRSAGRVSVAVFTTDAYAEAQLSTDYDHIRSVIDTLQPQDRTNLSAGIEAGLDQLELAGKLNRTMVLLSDGQANEGLTETDEILAGPVARANGMGVQIYTIGFGDQGQLNEPLLQAIASATGGEYRLADARKISTDLASLFVRAQVAATQTVLSEFQGNVSQGETALAGEFTVPASSGRLQTILTWPGSTLELQLTDPDGAKVDANYPGYKVSGGQQTMTTAIVDSAKPGNWSASVYGADVTATNEPFYSIVSLDEATTTSTPGVAAGGGGSGGGIVMLLVGMGLVAIIAWAVTHSMRGGRAPAPGATGTTPANLGSVPELVDSSGRSHPLRHGVNKVGRSEGNDIEIVDASVSRWHAEVLVGDSHIEVRDLDSSLGTYINGAAVGRADVRDGDEVTFGQARMRFWSYGGMRQGGSLQS